MKRLLLLISAFFLASSAFAQVHMGSTLPANTGFAWLTGDYPPGQSTQDGNITTGGGGDIYHTGGTSGDWSMQQEGGCYRVLTGWVPGQPQYVYVFDEAQTGFRYTWVRYKVKTGPTGALSTNPNDWTQDGNGWICKG